MNKYIKTEASYSREFSNCIQAIRIGDFANAKEILSHMQVSKLPKAAMALHSKLLGQVVSGAKTPPVEFELQTLLPGVSIVAACMNRHQNLLKVLPSWLATEADEIIIVDWSSREELWPMLKDFNDTRLKVIRIDGEAHWILTHALNLGLRQAQHETVYKFDCDIRVAPDFIHKNPIRKGEFIRGFWKLAVEAGLDDQKYVNGTFGAFKKDLIEIGYYDERIVTYGWDDSDIYMRLTMNLGLAARLIDQASVWHIEQQESQRTENQDVNHHLFLGRFGPTEMEGAKNKFYTQLAGAWGHYSRVQCFELAPVNGQLRRGSRSTDLVPAQVALQNLAEIFAVRQLALWAADVPASIGIDSAVGLELSRLLRDAHASGRSEQLLSALQNRQGLHFVRVPQGPLHKALLKTLSLLVTHRRGSSNEMFILEDEIGAATPYCGLTNLSGVFFASSTLIEAMAGACTADRHSGVMALEEVFLEDVKGIRLITLNRAALRDEILTKTDAFVGLLGKRFVNASTPLPGTCLVTSMYDEHNLIRLVEYLSCVVLNLRVFERIVLAYESHDGLLQDMLCLLMDELQVPIGRLLITPFNKRPTFEELFTVKAGLPDGTLLAVVNADIVFDQSLQELNQIALDTHVAVLSRWDVIDAGRSACLIRLDNGSPNTFSADAWIVRTPFEPDFRLDYPIGTMHCDSFINNQLSLSNRYSVVNPCLDVRVYHLHDERFNSSAEKQVRDDIEIKLKYGIERARNGDNDPVKGVSWSSAAGATLAPPLLRFQTWRPKALVVDFASCNPNLGHLLLLHSLRSVVDATTDTVFIIRLREADALGVLGKVLRRYQAHFAVSSMVLDIDEQAFDTAVAAARKVLTRTASFVDAVGWLQDIAPGAWEARTHGLIAWPGIDGLRMVRGQILGELEPIHVLQLIDAIHVNAPQLINSFQTFYVALPAYSAERGMLTPFMDDLGRVSKGEDNLLENTPRVSFVTSLFRGADLLPGYLDNVLLAARLVRGEVIIVDANIDEVDGRIVRHYLASHPDASAFIRYIRLDKDPGLYNCWRIAIQHARAPLISNANLDDKRGPYHTARLVDLLEAHPEYAGACGSMACIQSEAESDWYRLNENQIWFHGEGSREIGFEDLYLIDNQGDVRSRNVMHCMPVWRKNLHIEQGYFDEEKYGTSADWAFWLQCAKDGKKFYFEEQAFGRYYLNPDSHNRRNDKNGEKELKIIVDFLGCVQTSLCKQ